jgi:hypothetical protein
VTFTYAAASSPALTLAGLSLTRTAFRVAPPPKGAKRRGGYGTAFRFNLSIAAQVSIAIERRQVRACGRQGKGKCAGFTPITTLGHAGTAGENQVPFSGRYGKRRKPLKPGRYRATVTAADTSGKSTQPQQLTFKVLAP